MFLFLTNASIFFADNSTHNEPDANICLSWKFDRSRRNDGFNGFTATVFEGRVHGHFCGYVDLFGEVIFTDRSICC